jgi:hypothetical protein
MTPENQREALTALAEMCGLAPEIRLGQLLAHLGFMGESHLGRGLAEMDDDELVAIMYRHRAELAARLATGSIAKSSVARDVVFPPGSPTSMIGDSVVNR